MVLTKPMSRTSIVLSNNWLRFGPLKFAVSTITACLLLSTKEYTHSTLGDRHMFLGPGSSMTLVTLEKAKRKKNISYQTWSIKARTCYLASRLVRPPTTPATTPSMLLRRPCHSFRGSLQGKSASLAPTQGMVTVTDTLFRFFKKQSVSLNKAKLMEGTLKIWQMPNQLLFFYI